MDGRYGFILDNDVIFGRAPDFDMVRPDSVEAALVFAGFKLQEFRMMRMYEQGIKILITNSDIPDTIDWYKKYFGYKEVGTLKKIHEFGRKDIDHWTTLQVDLQQWAKNRDK